MASVGQTIKRAVLLDMWEGSFLLSSVFAYFLGNAKSMKIKRVRKTLRNQRETFVRLRLLLYDRNDVPEHLS
jgi:hypothetical protein